MMTTLRRCKTPIGDKECHFKNLWSPDKLTVEFLKKSKHISQRRLAPFSTKKYFTRYQVDLDRKNLNGMVMGLKCWLIKPFILFKERTDKDNQHQVAYPVGLYVAGLFFSSMLLRLNWSSLRYRDTFLRTVEYSTP